VISAPRHPQYAAIIDLMRIDAGRFGADTSDEALPTRVLNRSVKEGLATTRDPMESASPFAELYHGLAPQIGLDVKGDSMSAARRVYRMRSSQRIVTMVILIVGLFFAVGIWGGVLSGIREPRLFEMMAPVVFSLVAALFAIRAFRNSVCFSEQAIELRGLLGTRILPLDKIKGRRRYLSEGDEGSPDVWHLVLEPNDDRFPKLDIEELYKFDDSFYRWFTSLPDLDQLDRTRPKPSNFGLM
jgi:hypothetical protein